MSPAGLSTSTSAGRKDWSRQSCSAQPSRTSPGTSRAGWGGRTPGQNPSPVRPTRRTCLGSGVPRLPLLRHRPCASRPRPPRARRDREVPTPSSRAARPRARGPRPPGPRARRRTIASTDRRHARHGRNTRSSPPRPRRQRPGRRDPEAVGKLDPAQRHLRRGGGPRSSAAAAGETAPARTVSQTRTSSSITTWAGSAAANRAAKSARQRRICKRLKCPIDSVKSTLALSALGPQLIISSPLSATALSGWHARRVVMSVSSSAGCC